jgi:PKD repeat protein
MSSRIFWVTLFIIQVIGFGEILNKKISVTPARPSCRVFPPNCVPTTDFSVLDAAHVPPDWQCPCPIEVGDTGGALLDSVGTPITANPETQNFQDYVVADGFINPITASFSDSSAFLYVGERQGQIWKVDLITGLKDLWADLSNEIGFSGDRGLMDIKTYPNFVNTKNIVALFTQNMDPGTQPDPEVPANQRVVRLQESANGLYTGDRLDLIGGGINDGGYGLYDGVPICYNTHALGQCVFGHDGSLLLTTGEGSHWNFDMGDWGQPAIGRLNPLTGNYSASLDAGCPILFGNQSVGAWRAQIHYSLGGKMLRITPDVGDGVCSSSPSGAGYAVKNPFCTGNARDPASRIWAVGLRNPFRMTMRPWKTGDTDPGVFYFGDVGLGGYEELNLVDGPGLNFGWPCWEGPLPNPPNRDSHYNDDPHYPYSSGCGGSQYVKTYCGNITYLAYDTNGIRWTCPHLWQNHTTRMPWAFWTRSRPGDNAGYFDENFFQGMGFYGATTAGVQFYSGTTYPPRYWGQLFALDFTENWINVMYNDGTDTYLEAELFAQLIYTDPKDGAKVTLLSGPNGDICYITLNGGEVRCFSYTVLNTPPIIEMGAVDNTGGPTGPVTIQFTMDGTYDLQNHEFTCEWNFGDGTTSTLGNPVHTYTVNTIYNVSLTCTDIFGLSAVGYMEAITNDPRPKVTITSPLPNLPGNVFVYSLGQAVNFSANAIANGPVTWAWEYQFVHFSHIHENIRDQNVQTFQDGALPDESAAERNNLLIYARATDKQGLTGEASIRISRPDWLTAFQTMRAPVPLFIITGQLYVGQPITFDARTTYDPDLDRITYTWYWGDGLIGDGEITTHVYDKFSPTGYTVTLNASDNWGLSASLTQTFAVSPKQSLPPGVGTQPGPIYADINVTLTSIEKNAIIYYEIVLGNGVGLDVTPCSSVYTGPLVIPSIPGQNITVLTRALAPGSLPSILSTFTYVGLYAPCDKMGLGNPGNAIPGQFGSLYCSNVVTPDAPSNIVFIPYLKPYGALYTVDPPTDPTQVLTFAMRGLYGTYDTTRNSVLNTTMVNLWVSQNTSLGAVALVRASYDFKSRGVWDRNETFQVISPDPLPHFQLFNYLDPLNRFPLPFSITGTGYEDLVNGTVLFSFWTSIQPLNNGSYPIFMRSGEGVTPPGESLQFTYVDLPYVVHLAPTSQNTYNGPTAPASTTGCSSSWPTGPGVTLTTGGVPTTFIQSSDDGTHPSRTSQPSSSSQSIQPIANNDGTLLSISLGVIFFFVATLVL